MIEVLNLTKKYAEHTAVSDLTFTVEDNQVYGFLGPNGAGKSTTMNIITGCLSATEGSVKINGYDIFDDAIEAKKLIGYLPEIPPLYVDMTPKEFLGFIADAKKVKKTDKNAQIESAMEKTGIKSVENKLIKSLSKGYRQRVGIAQALIGNPAIIILDEPTVGLDPKQIIEIRELIKDLGKEHTVILSSHILSEVQAICGKILIIAKGKLVACDTPEKLEEMFAGDKRVELVVRANEEEALDAVSSVEEIKQIQSAKISEDLTKLEITANPEAEICEKLFFVFSRINKTIVKMNEERATLESIFLTLTQDSEDNKNLAKEEKPNESDIQA